MGNKITMFGRDKHGDLEKISKIKILLTYKIFNAL